MVKLKDPAIGPESLDILKEMTLVRGHTDGDASGNCSHIALRLVTMMMRVEDPVDLAYSKGCEMIEDAAGTEVYHVTGYNNTCKEFDGKSQKTGKLQNSGTYSITVSSPETGCSVTTDTLIQVGAYPVVKFAQDTFTLPTGYLLNLSSSVTNGYIR